MLGTKTAGFGCGFEISIVWKRLDPDLRAKNRF
jgi:hypothetical protein